MTGDIVNLRRLRKARAKTDRATEAAAKRAKYGQTRVERDRQALETNRAATHLDGHRRLDARDGETDTRDGE